MKFQKIDKQYLSNRKQLSIDWSLIDHWPLYVGIGNLSRYIAIYELLKLTLDIPGHIAEFGSWKGSNLMFMTKLMKILDPLGCKEIHCFESFEGLKTFSKQDKCENKDGEYNGNLMELWKLIELYELEDDITIHKGNILETLSEALENEALYFSFVYCDTDLYAPTKAILDNLHSRLVKGGLFVFDEWNYLQWQGETQAVDEFLLTHKDYEMIHVRNARQPSLVLKKC